MAQYKSGQISSEGRNFVIICFQKTYKYKSHTNYFVVELKYIYCTLTYITNDFVIVLKYILKTFGKKMNGVKINIGKVDIFRFVFLI